MTRGTHRCAHGCVRTMVMADGEVEAAERLRARQDLGYGDAPAKWRPPRGSTRSCDAIGAVDEVRAALVAEE